MLVSRWLCSKCLTRVIQETYSHEINFEYALVHCNFANVAYFKYLDVWGHCTFASLSFSLVCRNENYVWFGCPRQKTRYTPLYGNKTEMQARVRSDLLCKVARMRQLHLTGFDISYPLLTDICELQKKSFTICFVYRIWQSIGLHDSVYHDGLIAFKHAFTYMEKRPPNAHYY